MKGCNLSRIRKNRIALSSAFHVSPFDEAAIISVDGFGDFSSAAWASGTEREIKIHGRVYFPLSLGVFYQALTQYLGFPHYGDEYKMMGLAAYGGAAFLPAMRKIVCLEPDGSFRLDLKFFRRHDYKAACRIVPKGDDGGFDFCVAVNGRNDWRDLE